MTGRPQRLLVILADRLSALVKKGEITEKYYNPGNFFEHVTLLLTNDDVVDPADLQKTVGTARLEIKNLPVPSFSRSLGWRPGALKPWLDHGVQLAKTIKPDVIRTHGNFENGFLAAHIKKSLGVPLVVSLHTHPEEDLRKNWAWWPDWKYRIILERTKCFERETLSNADWVLPVYEALGGYAQAYGAKRVKVCYNALNPISLREKTSYKLNRPARIVSVGRLMHLKNPENIIRAAARVPAHLTIIGDGAIYDRSVRLAARLGGKDKFEFIKALPNDEICKRLPQFDLFAVHCQAFGIPKTVLEAMLTGLPIIANRRKGAQVKELNGDWVRLVDNTSESYYEAFTELLENESEREALGRRALRHSRERYSPQVTEAAYAEIYRNLRNS